MRYDDAADAAVVLGTSDIRSIAPIHIAEWHNNNYNSFFLSFEHHLHCGIRFACLAEQHRISFLCFLCVCVYMVSRICAVVRCYSTVTLFIIDDRQQHISDKEENNWKRACSYSITRLFLHLSYDRHYTTIQIYMIRKCTFISQNRNKFMAFPKQSSMMNCRANMYIPITLALKIKMRSRSDKLCSSRADLFLCYSFRFVIYFCGFVEDLGTESILFSVPCHAWPSSTNKLELRRCRLNWFEHNLHQSGFLSFFFCVAFVGQWSTFNDNNVVRVAMQLNDYAIAI